MEKQDFCFYPVNLVYPEMFLFCRHLCLSVFIRGCFLWLSIVLECAEVQRGKKIVDGFCTADLFDGTVGLQQQLGGTGFAIVVEAHRVAVRTGIVDDHQVAHVDCGQVTLHGEFVVILAERTNHVVNVIQRLVFFADHGDVVVRAIEGGTHQVGHAGVEADVIAVDVFAVDGVRYQIAVGCHDDAAIFREDVEWRKPRRNNDFFVLLADARADAFQIDRRLFGTIRHADTTTQIDKVELDANFLADFDHEFKEHAPGFNKVFRIEFVGREHGMQTETLDALFLGETIAFKKLFAGEAVLGFLGRANDGVAAAQRAWVVTETEQLGQFAEFFFQERDMCDVIQIDECAEFDGFLVFVRGRFVGREHDTGTGEADLFREDEFCERTTVCAHAFFFYDFHQVRIGGCLDGEKVSVRRRPGEGRVQSLADRTDARFIVQMKRRRVCGADGFELLLGEGECLGCHYKNTFIGGFFAKPV